MSKWIYKTKYRLNGAIDRDKTLLVAGKCSQKASLDYNVAFMPVVKASAIHLILSLALTNDCSIKQLDFKNTFIYGDLTEYVYMTPPKDFVDLKYPRHACKLLKSIYGLKQAPRAWFHKFASFPFSLWFVASLLDSFMFVLRHGSSLLILLLYVAEISFTGNDTALLLHLIRLLSLQYST